ncbi:sugar phosphate isomerase/epimerase family protein [Planctopirus hydrillae]|uniref:Sugar phosphate isomerase n=1 Tax=Planctopirus hydrillae TaxID=1841610 RepID=A0A1C3E5Q6_9PLAN|nr:sugar phosphate isomerase/epimerase family protein [Planctopirus hydrillae]ODA28585.1 sugar phosphate isomerase [Planctopirus hydrillae]
MPILSAVTISLVEEARGGPFVFWDDVEASCRIASELGFDAVELFAPEPGFVPVKNLQEILSRYRLKLAAVGTGAGWLKKQLSLTSPNAEIRQAAKKFITSMIEYGGQLGAPAIIGSMQGKAASSAAVAECRMLLGEALAELCHHSHSRFGLPLIYEPLNRYETNLCNTQADGAHLLQTYGAPDCKLLADLFHMNIEEINLPQGLLDGGSWIGHIHYVDSNRNAAGMGHIDFAEVIATLKKINYEGYLSAEARSLPDARTAAQATIDSIRQHLGK